MSERSDAVRLAGKLLDEPGADPDDDLRVLSRQLLRHVEAVAALKKDLAARDDPAADLIAANRDTILDMHREAVRRVRKVLESNLPGRRDLALDVLDALGQFHPMHGESWPGWPQGTYP
jgi:hypothetical protein